MLAFLALGPDGVRARRRIEAMFWGGRARKQAQDSLRRELSNLRKRLRAAGADHILTSELRRVTLALEHVEVDMIELARRRLPSQGGVGGEFLEGIDLADADEFEEWLREQRVRAGEFFDALQQHDNQPDADSPAGAVASGPFPSSSRSNPKPALAVLPFATRPVKDNDLRGFILSEMLSLCLSEFPQLLVVSSNAAAETVQQIPARKALAAALDVQYLIEGTALLGEADGRHRVFAKIIDGASGEQVWSGQFEGRQDDLLTFERAIAEAIAPQIWTGIDLNERRRILQMRVPPNSSYDRYWQANALYRSWQPADLIQAAHIIDQLVDDEPNCPWATSLAAFCHATVFLLGVAQDPGAKHRIVLGHVETAMRTGADNLESLGYCAGALLLLGENLDLADLIIARALGIMPFHQPALFWGGWVDLARGDARRSLERFELAMRINPTSNARGEIACGMAVAHLAGRDWDSARTCFANAQRDAPNFPLLGFVAPALAMAEGDPASIAQESNMLVTALRMLPQMTEARPAP